jgi:hypothetical protein
MKIYSGGVYRTNVFSTLLTVEHDGQIKLKASSQFVDGLLKK